MLRTIIVAAALSIAWVLAPPPAVGAPIAGVDFENDANTAYEEPPDDLDPVDWISVSADWTNPNNLRNDNGATNAGASGGAYPSRLQGEASWSITIPSVVMLDLEKVEFDTRGATGSAPSTPSGRRGDFGTSLDGGIDATPLWSNTNLLGRPDWTPVSVDLSDPTYQGLTNQTVTFSWKGTSAIDLDTIVVSGTVRGADGGAVPAFPTLTAGDTVQVSNNHSVVDVSVFPGKAGYDGNGETGVFGDGTVLDYRFFNNTGSTFHGAGYADGGAGLVSEATATNSNGTNGGALDWADVWTTGDPDADPADFTSDTFARSQGVRGTVDISGLESGQLYFIHGSFTNAWTLALTMTGDGVPELNETYTMDPADGVNMGWITDFTFDNPSQYEEISWNYSNIDTDGSRARFMGVVLDGTAVQQPGEVPEPATMALLALAACGLGGYVKRRRTAP